MKERWARVADRLLVRSPVQPVFRWYSSRNLVVLAYHDIMDPDSFESHVRYITEHMSPVSLDDVIQSIRHRRRLPPDAVLVTFDDGHYSVYDCGLPVLRRYDVPAVTFVVADLIDTDQPFWWDEAEALIRRGAVAAGLDCSSVAAAIGALKRAPNDHRRLLIEELRAVAPGPPIKARQLTTTELRTLIANGIAIGNHTLTHPCLDRCSDDQVRLEIAGAHDALVGLTGVPCLAFAYPNGNRDMRASALLDDLGYDCAFLFDHRVGRFPPLNRFGVSRVRVNSTTNPDRFRLMTSGLLPALQHAVGRV